MERKGEMVPVVTAFVHSGGRIALIRRSQGVRTYKGKWAGFSGYIEGLPLNQAKLELLEEAALEEDQVRLQGIGIPTPVDDPESGGKWLVFPFLFELAEGAEIATDWETEEWGWFHPTELDAMDTVPGLSKVLHQVWPPAGDDAFWSELTEVATDTTQGSTGLAHRALVALGGYTQEKTAEIKRAALYRAIRAFAACRPSMGVFPNLASRLMLGMCRTGGEYDFDELLTEMIDGVEDATALSAKAASIALLGKRCIFTLSSSEAAVRAIMAWQTVSSEIVIAESLPGREGLALRNRLMMDGVNAFVIPDSEIAKAVHTVDAVLVGCDAITDDDKIRNKVGTALAVSEANRAGIPVFCVAQTFKILPPEWPTFMEIQSSADIGLLEGEEAFAGPVFDESPLASFDAILTEEGILTHSRLDEIRTELGSMRLVDHKHETAGSMVNG